MEVEENKKYENVKESPVICFCNNVTEAEIIEHITIRRCCSTLEDIQGHTGANTGNQCHVKNPAGT
jgi:NAD(P)H-nitrite reductase large subunit